MYDNESFHVFRDDNASAKVKEKINRSNLPRKARNFSKEQLQLALRKKKECNVRAQAIVEALLEPIEDSEWFLVKLRDINQCHYEDVIEERAIQRMCGYPLCSKQLTNVPKQKYVISLSNKKVYDITERKNFCTGECYKASNYVKSQMLTSPLWLRDQEDIPNFKLLPGTPPKEPDGRMVTISSPLTSAQPSTGDDDLRIVENPVNDIVASTSFTDSCLRGSIRDGKEITFKVAHETTSSSCSDNELCKEMKKMTVE
ncbi:putative RNA polymerase II subunit B1 CTD phosphatase RPAP2 homolog [Topomyia yanbarensis]|uniref:putative RNA polymerase II subunit B1 CTD phosphatase RPAP2 homolog n=1 Tax=Topomyia yanbarensis TaxID=2498891 RepID=UPI00273C35E8|nr:putative RNA polymerase II subunit B1 CTD phosphatase RPAP2 homolog [Topomyia yanbarensis]